MILLKKQIGCGFLTLAMFSPAVKAIEPNSASSERLTEENMAEERKQRALKVEKRQWEEEDKKEQEEERKQQKRAELKKTYWGKCKVPFYDLYDIAAAAKASFFAAPVAQLSALITLAQQSAKTLKFFSEAKKNSQDYSWTWSIESAVDFIQRRLEITEVLPERAPHPDELIFGERTDFQLKVLESQVIKNAQVGAKLNNVMLYGEAGTGKTGFAESLAHYSDLFKVYKVSGHHLADETHYSWLTHFAEHALSVNRSPVEHLVATTSAMLGRPVPPYRKKSHHKVVIIVDEAAPFFKALQQSMLAAMPRSSGHQPLKTRGDGRYGENSENPGDFFHSFKAKTNSNKDYFMVFTTNHVLHFANMDDAITRRFHEQVRVPLPDASTRIKLLEMFVRKAKMLVGPKFDPAKFVEAVWAPVVGRSDVEATDFFIEQFVAGSEGMNADSLRVFAPRALESALQVFQSRRHAAGAHRIETPEEYAELARDFRQQVVQLLEGSRDAIEWIEREKEREKELRVRQLRSELEVAQLEKAVQDAVFGKPYHDESSRGKSKTQDRDEDD